MLDDFLFGAATSAYQIEGAWDTDGKVPSIWDDISHKGNVVLNGQTGDVACDHYYRWQDDLAVIKSLGIQAYRFSISWSRVINGPENIVYSVVNNVAGKPPEKTPSFDISLNYKGIMFYKNLVNGLKSIGVEPFVTLYHWDLPSWLDAKGGWDNPECVNEFVRYAELMFKELPEVKYWITFNEPAVFVGNRWGLEDVNKAIPNILLAHAKTYRLYKEKYDGHIGISLNLRHYLPVSENKYDRTATQKADMWQNRLWLDPIYKGHFPKGINDTGLNLMFSSEDKKLMKGSSDFLGINYYGGSLIAYDQKEGYRAVPIPRIETDDLGFVIYPQGLYLLLKRLKDDYNNPEMYITESGCCYSDTILHDGSVPDAQRQKYIKLHLLNCDKAIEDGVNLRGYFYWSLLDNFEWTLGYSKRFGLVYIDYPTLERIPKKSYYWYEKIIRDKEFREKELA